MADGAEVQFEENVRFRENGWWTRLTHTRAEKDEHDLLVQTLFGATTPHRL